MQELQMLSHAALLHTLNLEFPFVNKCQKSYHKIIKLQISWIWTMFDQFCRTIMKYKCEGKGNRADILVSAGQPGIEPRQLSCFRVGSIGKGTMGRVLLI